VRTDQFSISTRGQAMAAGVEGDTIPVKNIDSERIVNAQITGPGVVRVPF